MDLMLDLETLGTRPTAPILSIGAAFFDRATGDVGSQFHVRCEPNLDHYDADMSTIRWWMAQSEAARASLAQERVNLPVALNSFVTWFSATADKCPVWALPASFDLPILENALTVEGLGKAPWSYDAPRDLRTLYDLAKITKSERVQPVLAHDALSDCAAQIATLVLAFRKLGL